MKSKLWKRICVVAAALVMTGTVVVTSGRTASAWPGRSDFRESEFSHGRALIGTWHVKVQLYNCQTEAPIGNPFASLLTFNEGGTMTGSTTNPGFAVGQRGPDQGVWSHEGRRTYSAKTVAFLFFTTPSSPPFNPGFQVGTQMLIQTIEFKDGSDEFTSEATTEFFDANDKSYRQGCASAVAQRLE